MFLRSRTFKRLSRFALMALVLSVSVEAFAAPPKKRTRKPSRNSQAAVQEEVTAPRRVMKTQGRRILQIVLNGSAKNLEGPLSLQFPELQIYSNALVASTSPYVNRVAQFTGTAPWTNGVFREEEDWRWSRALLGHPNVFDFFYDQGYVTAIAGEGLFDKADRDLGIAWDHQIQAKQSGEVSDEKVVSSVEAFLREQQSTPYFLTVVLKDSKNFLQNLGALMQLAKAESNLAVFLTGGEAGAEGNPSAESSFEQLAAVWIPNSKEKGTDLKLVSSVDWYATLCQWANLKEPKLVEGKSILQGGGKAHRAVVSLSNQSEDHAYHIRSEKGVEVGTAAELKSYRLDEQEAWQPVEEGVDRKIALQALPKEWAKTKRTKADIKWEGLSDGSVSYYFEAGDQFASEDGPAIKERGVEVQVTFSYSPKSQADAVLLSHGTPKMGFVVHLIEGRPAVTFKYEGIQSTLKTEKPLTSGKNVLRMVLGVDGSLSIGTYKENADALGYSPFDGGFPKNLEGHLLVGHLGEILPRGKFPKATAFQGKLDEVYYSVLPGVTEELRAAKAVPVE